MQSARRRYAPSLRRPPPSETSSVTETAQEATPAAHSLAETGLTIAGGVEGTDFTVDATAKKIVITSEKTLTVSGVSQGYSLEIAAGNHATLILANLTIAFDREATTGTDPYRVPIDIATNVMDVGGTERATAATTAADITNKTSLHLILADGTSNTLTGGFGAPALHCGDGSELMVDDSVLNFDSAGNHITPAEGRVPADATLANGTQVSKGDPLYTMDSINPGKLICFGGSGASSIGSGAHEDAGSMVFDGGIIETTAYGNTSTPGGTKLYCGGTGAGIGGGFGGGATRTVFNGGVVVATGSYHGAGIGAGCISTPAEWQNNNGGYDNGVWFNYPNASRTQLPNTIPSKNGTNAPAPDSMAGRPNAGDITINGGNITSEGFSHGYAFGNACVSRPNTGHELLITGGNLTPINNGDSTKLLGAEGMAITVQGGSFHAAASGFTGTVTNGRGETLTMVTIDLAGFEDLHDSQLKSLTVTVDGAPLTDSSGAPYEYGLPYGIDNNGCVYFWLPSSVNGKTLAISNFVASTLDENGNRQDTASEYDFVVPSVSAGSVAKRYVEINVDSYVNETPGLHDTLFKRYDGVEISMDEELIKTIAGFNVPAGEPKDQYLSNPDTMHISYRRTLDRDGNPTTDETKADGGYSDVGSYEVIVDTEEWATDATFSRSFWGHKLYFSSAIVPADSEVSAVTHGFQYSGAANELSAVTLSANVMPRTYATDELPAEATTCKAPTGTVQFYANGIAIGDPVALTAGGTNGEGYAYSTATLTWTDFENYQIPRNANGTVEIQCVYAGGDNFNSSEGLSTELDAADAEDFPFADAPAIVVKPQNPDPNAPSVPELTPEGLPTVGEPDPDAENQDIKNTLHNTVRDTYYIAVQDDGEPLDKAALLAWAQNRYQISANCDFGSIDISQDGNPLESIPTNTPGTYEVTIPVRDRVTGSTTMLVVDFHVTSPPSIIPAKPLPGANPGDSLPVTDVVQEPNRGTLEGNVFDAVSRPCSPNRTESPETVKSWAEGYYTIPEGCTLTTPVLKDSSGNQLDAIDASKPGSYLVEYDVVDPKGNITHMHVDYALRSDPSLDPQDPTKSELVDKGSQVMPDDTVRKDYEDQLPVVIVPDPDNQKPITPEDILQEANNRYDVPEDWTVEVSIIDPNGNPVDEIDPTKPGTYTVTLTYTTPDGDTVVVTQHYQVAPNGSLEATPLPSTGTAGNKDASDSLGRKLPQTGDATAAGIFGLGGASLISAFALVITRLRRRSEGQHL